MSQAVEKEIGHLRSLFWSARDPEGRVFAPLADAYRRAGDYKRALELLNEGLDRLPGFAAGHVVAARLYLEKGLLEEAELASRQALDLDDENTVALEALAGSLQALGRLREATEVRERLELIQGTGEAGASPTAGERSPGLAADVGTGGFASGVEGQVVDIADLAPDVTEPVFDLGSLAPDEAARERVVDLDDLAPPAGVVPEPVVDLDLLAPDEAATERVVDLDDLAPEEPAIPPVAEFEGPGPEEPGTGAVVDLDLLAPDETAAELVIDLEALAPDEAATEPVIELDDLAPVEAVAELAIDLEALAPEEPAAEPVAEAEAPAPEEGAEDLAIDLEALVTEEPAAEPVEREPEGAVEPAAELDVVEESAAEPVAEPEAAEWEEAIAELVAELDGPVPEEATGEPEGGGLAQELPSDEIQDEPLVTRTMAELYAQQGLVDRALEVFSELLRAAPDDHELRERVRELEEASAGSRTRQPVPEPVTEEEVESEDHLWQSAPSDDAAGVDTPFAWTEEEAEDVAEGPGISTYFDRILSWTSGKDARSTDGREEE